jgi:polyphosphate glucokinase
MKILGIDIGGSGIKGAVVDVKTGRLLTPRLRVATPVPAGPAALARALAKLVRRFQWRGPIGVGFPGIIRSQVTYSAANLHPAWIGLNLGKHFGRATRCPVWALNDADAAGLAEVRFGAGRGKRGTVLLLTIGTGIGSALFHDGVLFPNLEFGHLKFKDTIAEKYAAASVRKNLDLTWEQWGRRLNEVLHHVHFLVSADLIILGGGVSSKMERFAACLDVPTRILPARLRNQAGVVGAALAAAEKLPRARLAVKSFVPPAETADED